nr:FG-GAP repeat protein [Marinicella sp. NBU2979]
MSPLTAFAQSQTSITSDSSRLRPNDVLESSAQGVACGYGKTSAFAADTAIITAHCENSGTVYFYDHNGTTWVESLKTELGILITDHSIQVDSEENQAVFGVRGDSAIIFGRLNGVWQETARLYPSDPQNITHFGRAVAIEGNQVVVTAQTNFVTGKGRGFKAYVFEYNGIQWQEKTQLIPSGGFYESFFGLFTADIDGDNIIIGAQGDDTQAMNAGTAYVYELVNDQWEEAQSLFASDAEAGDLFGQAVSKGNGHLLISSHRDNTNGIDSVGSAYVFEKVNGLWTATQKIMNDDPEANDYFGSPIKIHGDLLAIGAPTRNLGGFVNVYENNTNQWTLIGQLQQDQANQTRHFGAHMNLFNNHLYVSADNKVFEFRILPDSIFATGFQFHID